MSLQRDQNKCPRRCMIDCYANLRGVVCVAPIIERPEPRGDPFIPPDGIAQQIARDAMLSIPTPGTFGKSESTIQIERIGYRMGAIAQDKIATNRIVEDVLRIFDSFRTRIDIEHFIGMRKELEKLKK